MAPSAIRSPTLPKVSPTPVMKLVRASSGGTAATAASTAVPSISAEQGVELRPHDQEHHGGDAEHGRREELGVAGVAERGGHGNDGGGHEDPPSWWGPRRPSASVEQRVGVALGAER